MARIRSIKPEFCQSETIGKLSRDARLLFVQLWTVVDDEGRARGAPRMLASLLFPYDDDAPALIDGWMRELESVGCIRRYSVEGSSYLDIPHWAAHQKIDHATKSRLPAFIREPLDNPREVSREKAKSPEALAPDLGPRTVDLGPRSMDQESPASASAPTPARIFEAECRKRVGQEPVLIAQDFHEIGALLAESISEIDILAGIDAAMADTNFRPRYWKQLVGWARRAAQDRLGSNGKRTGTPNARAGPRAGRDRDAEFLRNAMSPDDEQPGIDEFKGRTI